LGRQTRCEIIAVLRDSLAAAAAHSEGLVEEEARQIRSVDSVGVTLSEAVVYDSRGVVGSSTDRFVAKLMMLRFACIFSSFMGEGIR
jgi:hypothetical protein